MVQSVIDLPSGIMENKPETTKNAHIRNLPTGKKHINLTKGERKSLSKRQEMETAIALFLDLEQDRTWAQIADELNISKSALQRMSRTPEFTALYDEATIAIGHDPRLQAVAQGVGDLLPAAFRRLRSLINDDSVADGVALGAVKHLFEMAKVGELLEREDPAQFNNFMLANGVVITGKSIQVNIPLIYADAMPRYMRGAEVSPADIENIVDGSVVDVELPALSDVNSSE